MAVSGSRPTIESLVAAEYQPLYRYAYRLSGNAADAEDLTQETFCKAQSHLAELREPDRARAWLFRILRNVYLHRVRAERGRRFACVDDLDDLPERLPDPLPPVEPEKLQQALNELPEAFRTPVILFYFEDFSYRDIAAQMELPLGTVMSRLARAKAHLRARLLVATDLAAPGGPRRATNGL